MKKIYITRFTVISNIISFLILVLLTTSCHLIEKESYKDFHFEEWVQSELKSGKSAIVLPKGVHHAYSKSLSSKYLYISNNDDGLKNILFDLSNRENLVIDGNGAELILHGHVIPFFMKSAKNITIKNLTIDWAHPFFAQGEITEVGDNYFDVEFKEPYVAEIEDGRLVFLSPDLDEPMDFGNINFVNPKLERLVYKSMDEYPIAEEHQAEMIKANLFRIHYRNIMSPIEVGHVAVFQYEGRSSPAVLAHGGSDIHLENVTEYHAAAIANLFEGTTNIYVDSLQVIRRPGSGRWFTAHHDAIHFVDCRGDIHIKGSTVEWQGDDDINIHGIFRRVQRKVTNNTIQVYLYHFQQMGVRTLYPGDNIAFYDKNTFQLLGEGTLEKEVYYLYTAQQSYLRFKDELPPLDWNNIVVALLNHDIDVQISGNHFSNHRARNLIIKTPGKVRIHDNYFNAQGAAIKIHNEIDSWHESGPVEDVEIFNNVFNQCNNGGFSFSTIEITAGVNDPSTTLPVHKNISIHNNKIIYIFKPIMNASYTENLEFYDNEIVPGEDYEQWYKGKKEPDMIVIGHGVTKGKFQEIQ
ncbi:MAG: hypothetical protein WD577_05750 [Bacteroidales bacterium]